MRLAPSFCLVALVALPRAARADTPSCLELVRQGRSHEASHEEDRAMQRYGEALRVDSSCGQGYVALGELRAKMGDGREADRVLTSGLERLPDLAEARLARARVRRAMGLRADAEEDARALVDPPDAERSEMLPLTLGALREMASWYHEDKGYPAELAVWRRIYGIAVRVNDSGLTREAHAMVRALSIVVGPADLVVSPTRRDPIRLIAARVARE